MNAQRGSGDIVLLFNHDVRWGGWSTPRPDRFIPGKSPGTHCREGRVGSRKLPDRMEKRKALFYTRVRTLDHPGRRELLYRLH
jgi:hypothetical protein